MRQYMMKIISSILDISQKYGKQLIWIGAAFVLAFLVLLTDSKFFTTFSMVIYGIMIFLLIAVLFLGTETKGARSWFEVGDFRIQPAEFAKFATNLAIAYVMSRHNFKVMRFSSLLTIGLILALPAGLIILQNDTGSALVYSSFILVLFREGLHGSNPIALFRGGSYIYHGIAVYPFHGIACHYRGNTDSLLLLSARYSGIIPDHPVHRVWFRAFCLD